MARPREFDMDVALAGAMDVFWQRGYLGTNLPDLLTAMGLTRGSFYKAFGDKETAYLAALDRYDTQVVDATVAMLAACEGPDANDCLSVLFRNTGNASRGCFICNAMVELAPKNAQVAYKANQMAARLREAIRDVLIRFRPQLDDRQASELADVILHLYFGHQAMGKAHSAQKDWAVRLQDLLS